MQISKYPTADKFPRDKLHYKRLLNKTPRNQQITNYTHTHARTQARARTHTHTYKNILSDVNKDPCKVKIIITVF
jgi:hypothetical protein